MANPMSQVAVSENMHVLKQQKKMPNGSPKQHKMNTPSSTAKNSKSANGTRTGDTVSDDSDVADDDGGDGADDEADDSDEPDDMALSGVRRLGKKAHNRLTGVTSGKSTILDAKQVSDGAEGEAGNESDDEAYEAIADISDSDSIGDADESDILRSAEQDLIAEFERHERPGTANGVTSDMIGMSLVDDSLLAQRFASQDDGDHDELSLFDHTQDPFRGLDTENDFYQEMLQEANNVFSQDEIAAWRLPESENCSSAAQKRVRFEERASSPGSSISSDEDPADAFPDLFDEPDIMASKHQMVMNAMELEPSLDNESVFEYDFEDQPEKVDFDDDDDDDDESSPESVMTDDGDTTEEETFEEQMTRFHKVKASKDGLVPALGPRKMVASSPAVTKKSSPKSSRSSSNATASRLATPKSVGKPKTGTFVHDPTRASVIPGVKGAGNRIVCPTRPPEKDREFWKRARQAMGSREGSPGGSVSWTQTTPRPTATPQRPFTARSTLGTMFDGNLDFLRSNDEHGIAKELLTHSRKNSMHSSFTSNTLTDGDGTDESSNVNMADFVQMDELDWDMEQPSSAVATSPTQQDFFNESMFESSPIRDHATGLLNHFDQQRGLVSSFRNNQHIARHVSSLPADPARRAQMSEANALQQGRRSAANTPMTPARKKRQDLDNTGAGVKKTASPAIHRSHRRSRGNSLSLAYNALG